MTYRLSDMAEGLLEIVADVSHDPEDADWFDAFEYLEDIPTPRAVLKEVMQYMHEEYL